MLLVLLLGLLACTVNVVKNDTGCGDPTKTWYADLDGDGRGDPREIWEACGGDPVPAGYVTNDDDCDDDRDDVYGGRSPEDSEACDGIDNDCDGAIDEDEGPGTLTGQTIYYPDLDEDGYGAGTGDYFCAAEPPEGYALGSSDCDDTNAAIHPGAPDENCDGIDDDCDGNVDDGHTCP